MSAVAAALVLVVALPAAHPVAGPVPFREVLRVDDLVVAERPRPGRAVNEVRAVGIVDAPADAVWALVENVERHTELLPDTTVSRVLGRTGEDTFVLQRSEPALLDPREYVIATRTTTTTLPTGAIARMLSWRASTAFADVIDRRAVHVTDNTGSVTVEAIDATRSRVTLQISIDPAGFVPPLLVNLAQTGGMAQALHALSMQARAARR